MIGPFFGKQRSSLIVLCASKPVNREFYLPQPDFLTPHLDFTKLLILRNELPGMGFLPGKITPKRRALIFGSCSNRNQSETRFPPSPGKCITFCCLDYIILPKFYVPRQLPLQANDGDLTCVCRCRCCGPARRANPQYECPFFPSQSDSYLLSNKYLLVYRDKIVFFWANTEGPFMTPRLVRILPSTHTYI